MNGNKKPGEPAETAGWAQKIQLSQLDDRVLCQIDETVVQNVKAYSFAQSSNGKALLNLSIEVNAEVVSTTIQVQKQPHSEGGDEQHERKNHDERRCGVLRDVPGKPCSDEPEQVLE